MRPHSTACGSFPHARRPGRAAVRGAMLAGLALLAPAAAAQSVEDVRIPLPGTGQALAARLCRPAGPGPATLVAIAHGSPTSAAERAGAALKSCDAEATRWFTSRGYAVVYALRRGYGATGGAWAEGFGSCDRPDFARAGAETARDLDATVAYATGLPGIRRDGAVVVGQSAGGWGALAYDSAAHPHVSAFVAMAPGRGGHRGGRANANCAPDALAEAAGRYGRTATTPLLWIYAANDSFFGPDVAAALHARFTAAGGRAELAQLSPHGRDGHHLFSGRGGPAVWGPLVERYLAQRGVAP